MPSKKLGRPVYGEPKNSMFRVRMDKIVLEKLKKCSAALGVSQSEIVRRGVEKLYEQLNRNGAFDSPVKAKKPPED